MHKRSLKSTVSNTYRKHHALGSMPQILYSSVRKQGNILEDNFDSCVAGTRKTLVKKKKKKKSGSRKNTYQALYLTPFIPPRQLCSLLVHDRLHCPLGTNSFFTYFHAHPLIWAISNACQLSLTTLARHRTPWWRLRGNENPACTRAIYTFLCCIMPNYNDTL